MQYSIDADEEFLRVTISGRDEDRPPSEVCALVLAQNANHFINLLGRNHRVMVRNFTGLEPAKEWLRGNST